LGERNAHRLLVRRTEGKRPLGRPKYRCVDNIKVEFGEIGWSGLNWIGLVQVRDKWKNLVKTVMILGVPCALFCVCMDREKCG
jgi:hypothetical protein